MAKNKQEDKSLKRKNRRVDNQSRNRCNVFFNRKKIIPLCLN